MAAIVKKRLLRTGSGGYGASSADGDDLWIIRVDEQVGWADLLELWAADATLPQPRGTFKALGAGYLICERIETANPNAQRFLWDVTVRWKNIADDEPKPQTNPTPTTNSTDPTDWAPTVTRRPVTVQEPAESLFYVSGYSGEIHDLYIANSTAVTPLRSPVTNSARAPFRDNLPPHQRNQSLYTIRWTRATVPATIDSYELSINTADVTFAHRGFSRLWKAKTAKIESVQITQTQWGTQQLWEIVMEILHDKDGHTIKMLDHGMFEEYYPGDTYGGSVLTTCKSVLIAIDGRPTPEPVLLNGAGKRLQCDGVEKYGIWRDYPLSDFNVVPLLGDLVT